jgi:hypothetical protein
MGELMHLRLRRPYIARTPLGYPTRAEDCARDLWWWFGLGSLWRLSWLSLTRVRTRQYEPWRLSRWERIRRWL